MSFKPIEANDVKANITSQEKQNEIINRPTFLEYKKLKFVIHDAPTDQNIHLYKDMLLGKNVNMLVRTCKPTYDATPLVESGITVKELPFKDGQPPPSDVINEWLATVNIQKKGKSTNTTAVHCVAGLGRAPILVAIAFIEAGMDATDAVEHIRTRRRGVFNQSQLNFLYNYKRVNDSGACCTIL